MNFKIWYKRDVKQWAVLIPNCSGNTISLRMVNGGKALILVQEMPRSTPVNYVVSTSTISIKYTCTYS